jgi:hypothetical protein
LFCYYKVPETNGVSLEQIEDNIRRGLPLREIGQPSVASPLLGEASDRQVGWNE